MSGWYGFRDWNDPTADLALYHAEPLLVPAEWLAENPALARVLQMSPLWFREAAMDALADLVSVRDFGTARELRDAVDRALPFFIRYVFGTDAAGDERVTIAGAMESRPPDVITGVEDDSATWTTRDAAIATGYAQSTVRKWCNRHGVARGVDGRHHMTRADVDLMSSHLGASRARTT